MPHLHAIKVKKVYNSKKKHNFFLAAGFSQTEAEARSTNTRDKTIHQASQHQKLTAGDSLVYRKLNNGEMSKTRIKREYTDHIKCIVNHGTLQI
jgi:hypothetical protein